MHRLVNGSTLNGVLGAAVLLAGLSTRLDAQLARRGHEFSVNASSEGDQTSPQIAALPDGGFFVVWQSGGDLMARRFSSASEPVGADLRVNESTPDTDPGQRLAVAGDGSVLVAWCAFMPPDSIGIVGRRYDATGAPDGPPFTVVDRGSYWGVAAGAVGAREFVVAWTDLDSLSARARAVGPTGVGPTLDGAGDGSQYNLAIGSAATERYQMVWYDEPIVTMRGRSFVRDQPGSIAFPVSIVSSANHDGPAICSRPAGDFVVTWVTKEEGPHGDNLHPVRYREYDAQSVPRSPAWPVTPDEIDEYLGRPSQSKPAIACGAGTGFTVVWLEDENPSLSIRGRRFGADKSSPTFRIGLESTPTNVSVARLSDGDDVVTWSECATSMGCDIVAQRFTTGAVDEIPGDCDRDGQVNINDLVAAVGISLAGAPPSLMRTCLAADIDLDYEISIHELILAVHQRLGG